MTREEAIKELEYVKKQTGYADAALDMAIRALEQTELNPSYNGIKNELEPCEDWKFYYKHGYAQAKRDLEQTRNEVLDKIKAEIEALSNANPSYTHTCDVVDREDVLDIIDKYKAENEDEE